MKKKLLSVLLAGTMALSLLTGCGANENNAGGKQKKDQKGTQLEVWLAPVAENTKEVVEPLLTNFEKEHDCKVKVQVIPWENYTEKWATAVAGGETPDVGYMYVEMFPDYITSGIVEDMSKYITDKDREEYLYLDKGYMMDGQYGIPFITGSPFVMYYNKDILDELNEDVPETWDDFYRICKKSTKDTDGDGKIDQYGYATGLNAGGLGMMNSSIYGLIWQASGDIYEDNFKKVKFNNAEGVKAIEYFKSLKPFMPKNVMALERADAFDTIFGEGKAAFAPGMARQSMEEDFAKSYPNLKNWDFITSLKDKQFGTFGAADSLALLSNSQNKELAMELIRYMTHPDFQKGYLKSGGMGVPLTKEMMESYELPEKAGKILTTDRDKWRPLQAGPCGNEILKDFASRIQEIMGEDADVKKTLDESATFANDTLKEFWENQE